MTILLKDFVSDSLTQVIEGIKQAQNENESNAEICPQVYIDKSDSTGGLVQHYGTEGGHRPISLVHFDLAVTVSTDKGVNAKGAAKAKGLIGVVAGSVGLEVNGSLDKSKSEESRLRFVVPVRLPWKV